MVFSFSRFRQFLGIILAVTAAISVALGIYCSRFLLRPGIAWFVVSVGSLGVVRSVWSLIRKPAFAIPQSVASEAIGLFVLFPFHLIIALLVSTLSIKHSSHQHNLWFTLLRVFALSSTILHMVYTVGLIVIASLTIPAFDPHVWSRDIDSSPSPFPMAIIFAFTFPCLAHRFELTRAFVRKRIVQDDQCLPTCLPSCNVHGNKAHANVEAGEESIQAKRTPAVLPHMLVRVPNAAERRMSIFLDLPIR